jgi:hypothetical protein
VAAATAQLMRHPLDSRRLALQVPVKPSQLLAALTLLLLTSCSSPTTPSGTLNVYTMLRPDVAVPNGVELTVDAQAPRHLAAIGSLSLSVSAGTHTLSLAGIPATCTLYDPNPQTVVVRPDSLSIALFGGGC